MLTISDDSTGALAVGNVADMRLLRFLQSYNYEDAIECDANDLVARLSNTTTAHVRSLLRVGPSEASPLLHPTAVHG